MALTPQNWTLNTYTNATWTDLVPAVTATILRSVVVSVGANAAVFKLRIVDAGGASLATLFAGE